MPERQGMKDDYQDWLGNHRLRCAPFETQGIWMALRCLMYPLGGKLSFDGEKPMALSDILSGIGGNPGQVLAGIKDLLKRKIAFRDEKGVLYSDRMVKEAKISESRAVAGAKGGKTTQRLLKQRCEQIIEQKEEFCLKPPLEPSTSTSTSLDNKLLEGGLGGDGRAAEVVENVCATWREAFSWKCSTESQARKWISRRLGFEPAAKREVQVPMLSREELERAIRNYAAECQAMKIERRFTYAFRNFVGSKAYFEDYADPSWTCPTPGKPEAPILQHKEGGKIPPPERHE